MRRQLGFIALLTILAAAAVLVPRLMFSRLRAAGRIEAAGRTPVAAMVPPPTPREGLAPDVWLVERTADSEIYSNGLRIDNRFLAATHPRSYQAFPADGGPPVRRTEPAGIAFHTTESRQAPFEASANRELRRIGESLLEYVSRRQAYNFVIDRFGRVYRVVAEDQAANHAGYSLWADEHWLYVNLNESFLGISFEAVSPSAEENAIGPPQTHAAAMLVEMLRQRYRIPAANCVAHAQVSVNPGNMRVGLHVDWAAGFPFEAIGVPGNYATPLPAVWAFGFDADSAFTSKAGPELRKGIEAAEANLARAAAAAGLPPAAYRQRLRLHYRKQLEAVRHSSPELGDPE